MHNIELITITIALTNFVLHTDQTCNSLDLSACIENTVDDF